MWRKEATAVKLFRMLRRHIRDAFKSVFRNFSLSVASITCITITLIIVGLSIIVSLNLKNFTTEIEEDVTMIVFLDADTTEEQISSLTVEINSIPNVEEVKFKSKNTSKNEMMQESDFFKETMSTWGEGDNPLKDSFQVKVKDIEKIADTAKQIRGMDKVAVVNYGEEMVNNLISAFAMIQKVAIIMVVALIVVTIFLIINTIKLTIFSRKREISIMRLVGASNTSIKIPFLIEGLILGFIGSIIPIVVIIYGYTALYNHLGGVVYSNLITLIQPEPFVYIASLIILGIGMLVGMVGSAGAVRKYLKV